MVKNFKLVIPPLPTQQPSRRLPEYARPPEISLPDISLPDISIAPIRTPRARVYNRSYRSIIRPTQAQFDSYNFNNDPNVTIADYTLQRQQDWGRFIALGEDGRNNLISTNGTVWVFANYSYGRKGDPDSIKEHTVNWDGIGTPTGGLSSSTFSQGKEYEVDGEIRILQSSPDKYTWAVWFLVNGIPSDQEWPPYPSKNPDWAFEPAWVEYPPESP